MVYKFEKPVCFEPSRPVLKPLDESVHIGGEKNIKILVLNLSDLVAYVRLLEESLKCYKGLE